jgi:hypothetical protein
VAVAKPSAAPTLMVDCDVGDISEPDIDTVDALACLALSARRSGCGVRLHHASSDLQALLALVGLRTIVPCVDESGVEARRQAEQREEFGRIEEERDPADPVA